MMLTAFLVPAGAYAAYSCSVSATTISFGGYDVFSLTDLDTTGTITFDCVDDSPPSPPPQVEVSIGPSLYGGFAPRRMKQGGGTYYLDYNLFSDKKRSTVWGEGASAVVVKSRGKSLTVYGRIPAGQNVQVGSYSDVVTISVTP